MEDLQDCLNRLVTWGMEFNVTRCKVMHVERVERNNPRSEYSMSGTRLRQSVTLV